METQSEFTSTVLYDKNYTNYKGYEATAFVSDNKLIAVFERDEKLTFFLGEVDKYKHIYNVIKDIAYPLLRWDSDECIQMELYKDTLLSVACGEWQLFNNEGIRGISLSELVTAFELYSNQTVYINIHGGSK